MDACLDDFLTRLNAAGSVEQLWAETIAFQSDLGFELAMYGYSTGFTEGGDIDVQTLSNFPGYYNDRYREERYHLQDPVVHHCIGHLSPKLIGVNALAKSPGRGRDLDSRQRRVVDEAAECGMKIGIVYPLRSAGCNPLGGISLSNAMDLPEFERFIADRKLTAHLGVVYAHTRIQMQLSEEPASDVSLTARERECLLWTSKGMSSKEVARRLDVSFKTVEFHIANAMNKLGALTRSHAVARAIALRLVHP